MTQSMWTDFLGDTGDFGVLLDGTLDAAGRERRAALFLGAFGWPFWLSRTRVRPSNLPGWGSQSVN